MKKQVTIYQLMEVRRKTDDRIIRIRVGTFDARIHSRVTAEELLSDADDAAPQSGSDVDETPGGIATVNGAEAIALVNAANAEDLEKMEVSERENKRHPGGRKGVLKAIEDRRKELAS